MVHPFSGDWWYDGKHSEDLGEQYLEYVNAKTPEDVKNADLNVDLIWGGT